MNVPFSPPDISEAEIEEVVDTLRSGWITTGPKTKQFEREIREYCNNAAGAVCLNSQTACAVTTLRILGIGPGDEVIVPAYTYTASASVVCHVGAKLRLVDIEKDTLHFDYDALEAAINEKTKVIIPVDIGGIMCDYDRIYEIVERKKPLFTPNNDIQRAFGRIIIMADGAHSFGATRNGVTSGTAADITNFSFHAVKNLTTAEGGAVTWKHLDGYNDDEIYRQYMLFSLHGQTKDAFHKNGIGSWEYDIVGTYYKFNMTDIMASLGLAQLHRYNELLDRRHQIIEMYNKGLAGHGVRVLEHTGADHRSSGHLYIIRVDGADIERRNEIIRRMGEAGIACNVHYKPLPMMTAYKKLGFNISNYPNAYDFFRNEITLPLHTSLTDDQVKYVIDTLISILG